MLFFNRDNQENIFKIDFNELMYDLNKSKRNLNVSSLEHTMCEFYKFYRSEILKSTKPKLDRLCRLTNSAIQDKPRPLFSSD